MLKYTINRLALALISLLIITAVTFFAMNAVPGGPFDSEKAINPETKQALLERYNLDKPLGEQFVMYLNGILHGDFGVSLKTGRDVGNEIFSSFEVSARLGLRSILVALIVGVVLGCISALFSNTFIDRIILSLTTLFISIPGFVIASLLVLVFCLKLKWFPVWSVETPSIFLPVVALSLNPMSCITRYTRTSMLDTINQDYIRTARSMGLSEANVLFRLALRNAAIPVITYIGPMTASVLTGSIVIETVFTIGGLGSKLVNAITNRDYTMIMGTTIFLSAVIILVTLLSDLLYKLVDPRITYG